MVKPSGIMMTDHLLLVLVTLTLLVLGRSARATCPTGCVCSQSLEDVVCEHVNDFPLSMPTAARNIQIAQSSLREIPSHAFTGLPHIIRITLHAVKVGAVRQFAFHDLAGRVDETSLSIINSEFDSIDSGAFSGMRSFLRILIHNCTVANIEKGAFVHFSNINMFQVISLRVAHIDSHAFANFRNVTSVGFSYWTAGHIRSHAFSDFRHIDKFDFSASTIDSLGSRFIGIRYAASVRFYSLQVTLLKKMAFADVSHVTRFAMYSSTVQAAEEEVFSHIHNVDTFHMLRMTITSLPSGFLPTRIKKLVFYSNKIGTLECGFLNETTSIPLDFSLANNKVTCDCRLSWLQTMALTSRTIVFDGFVCTGPGALKGGGLSSLFSMDTEPPCGDGIKAVHDCLATTTSTTTTTTTTTPPPTTTTTRTTTTTTPTPTTTTTPIPTTTRETPTTTTPTTTTTTTIPITTTITTTTTPPPPPPTTTTTTATTIKPTTTTRRMSTKRTYLILKSSTPLIVSLPLSTTTVSPRTAAADHGPIQAGVYSVIVGLVGTCLMVTYCMCEQR